MYLTAALLLSTQGRSITSSLPMLFPGASVLSSRTAWPEPEGAAALNCSSTASADTWSLQTFLCSQPMLSRDRQFVFVNGRLVSVPAVSEFMAAWFSKHRRVGQARDSSDLDGHSKGQHPGYLLLLSCPPAEVELVTELDSSLVATFKSRAALQGLLQAAVTTLQQPAASNPAPTAPAARCQTAAASRAVVSQQDWPQWAMWPQAPPGNEATMELPNRGSGGSGSSGRAARLPLPPALAVRPGTSRQPTAEQSQVSRSIIGNFLDGIARRSGSGGACRSGSGAAADAAAAGVTQRKVGSAATLQQPAELVGRLAKLQPSAQQPARWEQQQVQEQQQLVDTEADCGGSWRMQHQQEVSLTFSPGPDQRSKQGTDRQWLRSDAGDGRRVQNAGHTASRLCTAACTADLLLLERSEPIQARHDQLELLEAPQVRSTAWPVHGMSPPQQLADSPLEQYQSHKRGSCARVTASGFDLLSKSPVRGDLLPTTRRWQSNPGSDMVWDASSDLSPVAGSSAEMGLTGSYVCRQGRLTSLQQLPLDDVSPFAGNLSHLHATANQDQLFSLTSPCPMLQAPQGACGSRASSDSPAAPQFGADLELLPEPLPKQHGQGSGNTFQLLCGPGLPLIHEAVRRRGQALELGIAASPSLHDVCELSVSTDLPTSPSLECSVLRGMGRGCFADGMTSPAVVPVPAPAPTPLVTVSPLPSHAACGPEPSGRACRAQPAASPWATWSPRYDLGNTSPSPAAPLVPGSSPRQGCKVAGIANDRPAVQRCTPAPTGWRRRGDPELLLDAAEADTDADAEDGEACSDLSVSPGLVASVLFEEALQVAAPASKPSAQVAEAVRLAGQVQSQCESQHSEQSSAAPAAPPLPQPASPEGGQAVGLEAAGNVEEAMVDTPHSHLPVAAAAVEEIEAGQEPEQLSVCRRLQFGDQEQTTMQADEEGSTAIQYEQPAMAAEAAQQYASSPTATTPAGMEAAGGPADIMDASNVAELQAPTPLPAVLCAQAAQAVGEVQAGAAKCKPPRKRVQFTSPVAATAIKRPARTGLAGPAVCAAVAAPASTQQPTLAAALDAQSLASAAAAAAVMAPSRGCALGEGGENGDMNTLPAAVEGVAVAAEDMMDEDARSGDTELGNGSPGPDQAEEGSDNMLYSGEPEDYVDAASSFGAQLQSACNDVSPAWGSSAAKLAAAADSDSPVFSSPDGSIEDGSCGSAGSPDCQPACIGPEAERMAELFNEDETGGGAVNPVSMPSSEEGDGGLEAAGEQAGETALPTDLSPSEQHDDLASEQEGSAQGMDADAKQATIQPEAAMDDADAACEAACSPIELPSSAAACTQPMPTAATAPDTAEGMNTGEVHQRGKVQARLRQLLPRPAAQPHAANPLGGAGNLARTLLMGKRKAASHMPAPAGPPGPGAQDQTVQGQSALQRLLAGAWENPVKVQRQRLQATSVLSLEDLEGPAKGSTLSLRRAASKLVPADVTKPMLDSARVIGQVSSGWPYLRGKGAFTLQCWLLQARASCGNVVHLSYSLLHQPCAGWHQVHRLDLRRRLCHRRSACSRRASEAGDADSSSAGCALHPA